tara:strand:- start:15639 stop:15887 length:249 start_codon:yes stop_codon:yes gene_type:complete
MVKKPTPKEPPVPDNPIPPTPVPEPDLPPQKIPDAAVRALAEAAERRANAKEMQLPPELGGRDGPEAVRYGDWEKKGIAIDF